MSEQTLPEREPQPEAPVARTGLLSDTSLEIFAAVLLSITTIAAAWCAYQSTRWSGVQANNYAEAGTARVESTREFNRGMQLLSLDANTFLQYVDAFSDDKTALLEFFETRLFRVDFLPYFDAWMATDPLTNPDAPRNPFVNPDYQSSLFAESDALEIEAGEKFQAAQDANQTGDDYVLNTVFFASVLFFAGIASQFPSRRVQLGLFGCGVVIFVIVMARTIGMPIE